MSHSIILNVVGFEFCLNTICGQDLIYIDFDADVVEPLFGVPEEAGHDTLATKTFAALIELVTYLHGRGHTRREIEGEVINMMYGFHECQEDLCIVHGNAGITPESWVESLAAIRKS